MVLDRKVRLKVSLLDLLKPGDILLYRGERLLAKLIMIKTWSDVSHVETYIGAGQVFAARDEGVHIFPFDNKYLRYVLRPFQRYDPLSAGLWRTTVIGQRYDWTGLFIFYLAVAQGARDKMFCSEACTRDARAGGIEPFSPDYDADRVSPSHFLVSSSYYKIWVDEINNA